MVQAVAGLRAGLAFADALHHVSCRSGGVGIYRGDQFVHMAPPPRGPLVVRQLGQGQRQSPLGCGSAGDGLSDKRLLDAYDAVLEALQGCRLPIQPLVVGRALLAKHGNSPFWRTVKAEAIPLLEGCLFP